MLGRILDRIAGRALWRVITLAGGALASLLGWLLYLLGAL